MRKSADRVYSYVWGPFAFASLLFSGILAGVLIRAVQLCHGYLGYPMDDTYIHMAMAKNFALHGVWGVTRYGFSSSTSSPLYTLLLATVYWVAGVHEAAALALNVIAALALLAFAAYLFYRAGLTPAACTVSLAAIILLAPLPALVEGGMEHVLHALLTLIFVHLASMALTGQASKSGARWMIALSPILVMTRYEGAFLIFAVSLLFAIKRDWKTSIYLVSGACAALALYGLISIEHGWLALPNSVLLKAKLPSRPGFYPWFHIMMSVFRAGMNAPHVAFALLFALVLLLETFRRHRTVWTYAGLGLLQFLAICLLHLALARTGWFFRYEAYLIALAIVTSATALQALAPARRSLVLGGGYALAAVAVFFLGLDGIRSIVYAPRAFHNIYEQQYQTARFVKEFYPHDTIVLNDIGAVCFYTDARVLDVFGLGSMEAANAKMGHYYNTAWLRNWASRSGASLAVLYSTGWVGDWFVIPEDWPKIATWSVADNFVLAGSSVDVFAVRADSAAALLSSVHRFQKQLPDEVAQSGGTVEKTSNPSGRIR